MTATVTTVAPDLTTVDHLDFDPELPCEYGPRGDVLCVSGAPARWRVVYYAPCGHYAPQLICNDCRHRHRLYEIKLATMIELGHACVHCVTCGVHIRWQPAAVTPLPGTCP